MLKLVYDVIRFFRFTMLLDKPISQLRDEINYKNQQLASKDIEMETYKTVTEERIFKLEAKIKELEARTRRQK